MNFSGIEAIAKAVLYEGYILYPYRPSSTKNQQRWNFGTLYPRGYAEAQRPAEQYRMIAECLIEGGAGARIHSRVRFLRLVPPRLDGTPQGALAADWNAAQHWNEGFEQSVDHEFHAAALLSQTASRELFFDFPIANPQDTAGHSGDREKLQGRLIATAEVLRSGLLKLRIELANVTPVAEPGQCPRESALSRSFVSAHLILGIDGGGFVSLLDPPQEFSEAAASCRNEGVFPVLAGPEGQRTMLLCSPIILYDYPRVAGESAGDFFDGTEVDEMLSLRVLTLTDEEKREMRQGDSRAQAILERTEMLPDEHLMKVHGVMRGLHRPPEET